MPALQEKIGKGPIVIDEKLAEIPDDASSNGTHKAAEKPRRRTTPYQLVSPEMQAAIEELGAAGLLPGQGGSLFKENGVPIVNWTPEVLALRRKRLEQYKAILKKHGIEYQEPQNDGKGRVVPTLQY